MKYFDKEMYTCLNCGHKWILASDKFITDEQHRIWIQEAIKQHNEIQKRKNQ